MTLRIQGILLDFGGTIDTNGIHWAEVLWQQYSNRNLPVGKEAFREAYRRGERTLALEPIIKPEHTLYNVLVAKLNIQLQYLADAGFLPYQSGLAESIAQSCDALVRETVKTAIPVLDVLKQNYPIVLVSNFYGNINTVLEDLGIRKYFNHVVESAVVGVRKPDPEIFRLGLSLLGYDAANVVVIGDSYTKDIIPGKEINCHTIWLKGVEWETTSESAKADYMIQNFTEIPHILSPL